jgi:hypothetical protein
MNPRYTSPIPSPSEGEGRVRAIAFSCIGEAFQPRRGSHRDAPEPCASLNPGIFSDTGITKRESEKCQKIPQ